MLIKSIIISLLIVFSGLFCKTAAQLRLNEIQASNRADIVDEDGDYPDWIELFNSGRDTLDLTGYTISDRPDDTSKWRFPTVIIPPRHFQVIFASGKDRAYRARYHESLIRRGDNWRYFVGAQAPPVNWFSPGFDDAGWTSGPSGFGYGDNDDSTVVPQTISLFIRTTFTISDPSAVEYALLHIDYDDGFIAYLNGREIARANLSLPNTPVPYDQLADSDHEARLYQGLPPDLFLIENFHIMMSQSANVLAIEVHNSTVNSSDLTVIPFLTLGLSRLPSQPRGLADEVANLLIPLHTNFKINADGETLSVWDPLGRLVDRLLPVELSAGRSYGCSPDGSDRRLFFERPTPGWSNPDSGFAGICREPQFSLPSGFYSVPTVLSIRGSSGETVHFTRDGSLPNLASDSLALSIPIDTTTVIRAICTRSDFISSAVATRTYIVNFRANMPVISLTTDPYYLWNPDSGIYCQGANYNPNIPRSANYWQDWERPVHIEFFETDRQSAFALSAGIKIHGGVTREFPQKSVAILCRPVYSNDRMRHQIYPWLAIDTFKDIVLRNGGSDWNKAFIRDAMMLALPEDVHCDVQAYRPAVVLLNGTYWGIHDIREKLNEHYLNSHYDIDKDSVDRMEVWGGAVQGSPAHYEAMLDYIESNGLSDSVHYEYIKTQMDVSSFIDFNVTNIYCANLDWPGNNNKFWRPQTEDGRWRWFLFDLDFGFGLHDSLNYNHNTLTFAVEPNGPSWPNPPIATYLLRKCLESPQFRVEFINRFTDLMNFDYKPERVAAVIDSIRRGVELEMPRHLTCWSRTVPEWLTHIDVLYAFAYQRPARMREFIRDFFDLPGLAALDIHISPVNAGTIKVNSKNIRIYPWSGVFFRGVQTNFLAEPAPGYRFARWQGVVSANAQRLKTELPGSGTLTAVFEPITNNLTPLVINEINYHSTDSFDTGDWVEIYAQIGDWELTDYSLTDDDTSHSYYFPAGLNLTESQYVVITQDSVSFKRLFPTFSGRLFGNLTFGFGAGGDQVRLFDNHRRLIDSVAYSDSLPWPPEADGTGKTLELIDPAQPNDNPANWRASMLPYGSPGRSNLYHPPGRFALFYPPNDTVLADSSIKIIWATARDIDIGDRIDYRVEWSNAPDYSNALSATISDTFFIISRVAPNRLPVQRGLLEGVNIDGTTSALPNGVRVHWRVQAMDDSGLRTQSDAGENGWSFRIQYVAANVPDKFTVKPAYPNPFNRVVVIPYDLSQAGDVLFRLLDIRGREVTRMELLKSIGSHYLNLQVGDGGLELPSGVYLAIIEAGDKTGMVKMVLMR